MRVFKCSCGMEIRENEGWVCPYFSRPEGNPGNGCCNVDIQLKTNVCLQNPDICLDK